jgi:hypothetical protein
MQECKNALMPRRASAQSCALAALLVLVAHTTAALAQPADAVGVRAQGMAGAFTAVADDATATWWNPAGLAAGPYVNAILEAGSISEPPRPSGAQPGWRSGRFGAAAAFPALGLSYYHVRISELEPSASTAVGPGSRQDLGTGDVRLRSLVLSQFGATVGQSIGDHLVVASTLKLLRGDLATGVRPSASATLDAADALEGTGDTRGTFDVGAMAIYGIARAGLTVRNVTSPTFGSPSGAVTLGRQVRSGVALTSASGSWFGGLTFALDADLTRATTADGEERRVASGVEAWTRTRRIGIRAGVSASTLGERRATGSAGASLALRSSVYLDAQVTGGAANSRRGWGIGTRVTF